MSGGCGSMGFHERLAKAWSQSGSMLCIGLDPDPAAFPDPLDGCPDAIERFCTTIIDATADLVCAFKPQFAHFAANRAEVALEAVCRHIRERHPDVVLVLDAKRGDIGSTAEQYAREAFGRYAADAVTVNPYLGTDAAAPFLAAGGVLALCHTSNPGAAELQELDVDGIPLYERVATMVATRWQALGDAGLVVGATYPEQLARVRELAGNLPILLPGIGFQGGDLQRSVRAGSTSPGAGLLCSSSRGILYASSGDDFPEAGASGRAGDSRRDQRRGVTAGDQCDGARLVVRASRITSRPSVGSGPGSISSSVSTTSVAASRSVSDHVRTMSTSPGPPPTPAIQSERRPWCSVVSTQTAGRHVSSTRLAISSRTSAIGRVTIRCVWYVHMPPRSRRHLAIRLERA